MVKFSGEIRIDYVTAFLVNRESRSCRINTVNWINDENPLGTAARIAKQHSFQTPIDEEDAAARCVAPVLEGIDEMLRLGKDAPVPPFGKFFKDYRESEW